MNKQILKSFSTEIQKLASDDNGKKNNSGKIVGSMLVTSLLAGLAVTGAQHAKGVKEAFKAGSKFKHAFSAPPLPVGKSWRFEKLKDTGGKFKIPTEHVST